ncbi:hypothetical protein NE237_016292 [Protea cynaroides]|uniref:Uncharacterized protein n=1 Tax=Protea cynaroides TaxID=273540 RepID=A0A9Q0GKT6_9MAGN|nr:hypothetical protein NE237_016292 [Protea cynaroides]
MTDQKARKATYSRLRVCRTAHRIAAKPREEVGGPESTRLGPDARMNFNLFQTLVLSLALISRTEAERAEASGVHKANAECYINIP